MNEQALEAAAQAMCDRVNGQGDYAENIGQRRPGWLAQARAGVEAYLAASPKATATASVREAYKQAAYIARRFAEEVNEDGVIMHNPSAISAGNEICHRILKAAATLTDSGTAATIGGERA